MEQDQNRDHELRRERLARQGYINWRMRDVPAIYQDLMPYSYKLRDLMRAETAIRAQMKVDAKLINTPWREVGPVCNLLDRDGVSAEELGQFGVEMLPRIGMPHPIKPGFDDHPEVLEIHRSPEFAEAMRKVDENPESHQASQIELFVSRMPPGTVEGR